VISFESNGCRVLSGDNTKSELHSPNQPPLVNLAHLSATFRCLEGGHTAQSVWRRQLEPETTFMDKSIRSKPNRQQPPDPAIGIE
jgi:hypothetical protein